MMLTVALDGKLLCACHLAEQRQHDRRIQPLALAARSKPDQMERPWEVRASPEVAKAAAWLNSYPKASKWMGRFAIHHLLDENGGLVRIENFLPDFVAGDASMH